MSNIFKIMNKELDKIFKDKRLVFTTFIMPALIIFIIYGCMGELMGSTDSELQSHETIMAVNGNASALEPFVQAVGSIKLIETEKLSESEIKQLIKKGEIDIYVELYGMNEEGKLSLSSYADTVNTNSQLAVQRLSLVLETYRVALLQSEGVDTVKYVNDYVELASVDSVSVSIISMIVPMMLVIMLFANAMSISAEGIAGEKERGTLATLLMTPIRRSDIIFAKVFANSIITLLVAITTFIGMAFSLDSFTAGMGISGEVSYAFSDYVILLLIVFTIALTAVALFSVASTLAKNVKEASSISMPIYIIGMVAAIISAYSSLPAEWYYYLIPVYNCACIIKSVMMFDINALNVIITIASSVVYFVGVCLGLGRLFRRESIVFGQ